VLRDLDRPLFGKTGTTNGPTNVWFVGGTPDIVAGVYLGYDQPRPMGHAAQGGRISAPIWKQWALTALRDQPKTPFVAPPGIRWVRIDRASGKKVFGQFPTSVDPKSPVIWEAFQPQTEPRRSLRGSMGDPYQPHAQPQVAPPQAEEPRPPQATQPQPTQQAPRAAPVSPPPSQPTPRPAPSNLPTRNSI
jgi:penicillin-binding protein 1A